MKQWNADRRWRLALGLALVTACGGESPADGGPGADGGVPIDAAPADDGGTPGGDDGGAPDGGPSADAGACESGHHPCDDACVPDDDPATCGSACTPCPAPENAVATCEDGTCGHACAEGFHDCDGECVPETRSCGVPLPSEACDGDGDCGAAGECLDGVCACAAGHRPCVAGCCPVTHGTTTLTDVDGRGVQLEYGPDGTAYVLVQAEIGPISERTWELHLYTRAPGAATLERAEFTVPVSYDEHTFDFAIRSDGTLFAAVAPATGESTAVNLHEWRPSMTEPVTESMGRGFGYNIGVGLTIDDDDTVWASWSTARSGGLSAYSLASDGVRRSYSHSVFGTVAQTDVEWDPATDTVHSFWGHRYTGDFRSGVVLLDGTPALESPCPADDAAFDSAGHQWSIYNSYSSIQTYFCRDGTVRQARRVTVRGTLPTAFGGPLVVDGEDTAYVAFYEADAYTVHWVASRDVETWSRGELPIRYGLPDGSTSPAPAHVDSAVDPSGRVSFVVLPSDATMGPLTLVDFE
ncbi:MAG TPA: EB domain-containing protein [Sandaracinaceae bacterium LLY-WYZ-13_1]|nr:EB domain-containing protein [Sandaracinaceae bacterium LLY-WYZ-13_1]